MQGHVTTPYPEPDISSPNCYTVTQTYVTIYMLFFRVVLQCGLVRRYHFGQTSSAQKGQTVCLSEMLVIYLWVYTASQSSIIRVTYLWMILHPMTLFQLLGFAAPNGRMIVWKMDCNVSGRKRWWTILRQDSYFKRQQQATGDMWWM